jgi:hypothetical protein
MGEVGDPVHGGGSRVNHDGDANSSLRGGCTMAQHAVALLDRWAKRFELRQ